MCGRPGTSLPDLETLTQAKPPSDSGRGRGAEPDRIKRCPPPSSEVERWWRRPIRDDRSGRPGSDRPGDSASRPPASSSVRRRHRQLARAPPPDRGASIPDRPRTARPGRPRPIPDEAVRPAESVEAGGVSEILEGREGDVAAPGQGIAGPDLGFLETRCRRLDQRLDLPLPSCWRSGGGGRAATSRTTSRVCRPSADCSKLPAIARLKRAWRLLQPIRKVTLGCRIEMSHPARPDCAERALGRAAKTPHRSSPAQGGPTSRRYLSSTEPVSLRPLLT
ncbi:hypothetical protein F8B43_3393 [Methylorubrum populi]|uniref:Uncharacterized protein n=1 Tax=Methylorubrum populi TaxID=223967 RepID=A0A833MZS3_9HYPH|nr:hypothetical protein F8B43_3393 [Methylorubrum populi]